MGSKQRKTLWFVSINKKETGKKYFSDVMFTFSANLIDFLKILT